MALAKYATVIINATGELCAYHGTTNYNGSNKMRLKVLGQGGIQSWRVADPSQVKPVLTKETIKRKKKISSKGGF